METLYFDQSDLDAQARKRLIQLLPSDWAYLDGTLTASNENRQPIARATRLTIRERRLIAEFTGVSVPLPEILAIFGQHQVPKEVCFIQAGNPAYCGEMTLGLARDLAAHYVGLGHVGHLRLASRDRHHPKPMVTHAEVRIAIGSWSDPEEQGQQQPPRIRIDYNERDPAGCQIVDPVVATCRTLGLKQYFPEKVALAA